MGNSTDIKAALGSINLGNGLIEIAALTSLIGSTAAESLALGDKGPGGLAWAMMTIFGALSVVKLFIATTIPGWLRESVGVRSARSDAVVGSSLNLNKSFKSRGRGEPAKAVECEIQINSKGGKMGDSSIERERREVYVFDQRTANILNAIPLSASVEDLVVYFFRQDPWLSKKASYYYWLDWILLLLSMVAKLVEFTVLWRCGARMLAWITIFSWFFFFSAVISLQLHGIRRRAPVPEIDIIAGSLPTYSSAGGARKILLGIPKSTRHHVLWRFIWGLGSIVGITTVLATYLALGHSASTEVFFLWTGFQVLWLAIRSTLFYLLSDREGRYHVGLKGTPWIEVKPQDRARLRRLVFALSKYQVHLHPRTSLSYAGDIDVVDSVENVRSEYPLHDYDKEIIPISVHGVIPDTLLASTSWIFGSKQGGFDFYDTCIVVFNTPEGMISIPAARALSTQPLQEVLTTNMVLK